jgi:hypothetical protein
MFITRRMTEYLCGDNPSLKQIISKGKIVVCKIITNISARIRENRVSYTNLTGKNCWKDNTNMDLVEI